MSFAFHVDRSRRIADEYLLKKKTNKEDAQRWLQQKLSTEAMKTRRMVLEILEAKS